MQIGLSSEHWHIAQHLRKAQGSVQALNTGDKVFRGVSVHSLICRHRTRSGCGLTAAGRWLSRPHLCLLCYPSCGPLEDLLSGSRFQEGTQWNCLYNDKEWKVKKTVESLRKYHCCLEPAVISHGSESTPKPWEWPPRPWACPSFAFPSLTLLAPAFQVHSSLPIQFLESARLSPASRPLHSLFLPATDLLTPWLS